jgi:prepilin-type N-terminal cleavage/methylation domain-containing protein
MAELIRYRRVGFSLVELLVVIAIMAILLALLAAAVQKARGAADRVSCADNLRQIGLALHAYHGNMGQLPPGVGLRARDEPFRYLSWLARILPYMEHDNLWKQTEEAFRIQPRDWTDPPHVGLSTVLRPYGCPADGRVRTTGIDPSGNVRAFTSYLGVLGTDLTERDGVLYVDSRTRFADIRDGTK